MDYYDKKKRCFRLIDEMVKDGVDIEKIYFKVSTTYGFGKKLVDERVEMLTAFIKGAKNE